MTTQSAAMQSPEELADLLSTSIQINEPIAVEGLDDCGQSRMTTKSTMPSPKEMAEFVWQNKNINAFIERYNEVSGLRSQKLRIEKYSPHIYVIVMNKPTIKINGKKVLLAKVGFTQISVEQNTENRMETVFKKIVRMLDTQYKKSKTDVSIIFKFPIHALTIQPHHDIENSIREKVGFKLPKEKARDWLLPVHTEWVLTTQEYIDKIKKAVDAIKKAKGVVSTKIFKSMQGDNKACDLPRALDMKKEEISEILKELPFPLEKAESPTFESNAIQTTAAMPDNSPTASINSTPEAKATKTPRKSIATKATAAMPDNSPTASINSTPGAKATKTPRKTSPKDALKTAAKGLGEESSSTTSDEKDK